MHRRLGITLIELLIAIALLGIIVLGFSSMEVFSHFHVLSSDRRAKLQNEASFVLAQMSKQIGNAIGDWANPPLTGYADNRGFRVRVDTNQNGRLDPNTAVDRWIGYRHQGSQILFFPDDPNGTHSGASEVLATHVVITRDPSAAESATNPWGLKVDQLDDSGNIQTNRFNITVRTRWDPNPAIAVSTDNPEVILRTTVIARSVSTN